jgi:hypothetical protein
MALLIVIWIPGEYGEGWPIRGMAGEETTNPEIWQASLRPRHLNKPDFPLASCGRLGASVHPLIGAASWMLIPVVCLFYREPKYVLAWGKVCLSSTYDLGVKVIANDVALAILQPNAQWSYREDGKTHYQPIHVFSLHTSGGGQNLEYLLTWGKGSRCVEPINIEYPP